MKKFALFLVLVSSITIAFGQKNVRQSASNYLKDGKLDKSLEAINQCILDPSTAQDVKAWYIRGNVYLEIALTTDEKYKNLDPNPLPKALESYKKALELDPKKEYSKKEYYVDILGKLDKPYKTFFDSAAAQYNRKLFKQAMSNFGKSVELLAIVDITDTLNLLNAALCARLANENEEAKGFYFKLIKANYKLPDVYSSLSDIYIKEKDSANALKIVREGQKVNPNNLVLTLAESNVYIFFNDVPKALSTLTIASQKDSTNHFVFGALGSNYQKIFEDTLLPIKLRNESFVKAEIAYKKSIALKPDFFDAYINFASMYFNAAVPLAIKANGLPLEQKELYAKLTADANKSYLLALPYLIKANELQPNDVNTLNSLRQIYISIEDKEKLKVIQLKMNELRK